MLNRQTVERGSIRLAIRRLWAVWSRVLKGRALRREGSGRRLGRKWERRSPPSRGWQEEYAGMMSPFGRLRDLDADKTAGARGILPPLFCKKKFFFWKMGVECLKKACIVIDGDPPYSPNCGWQSCNQRKNHNEMSSPRRRGPPFLA